MRKLKKIAWSIAFNMGALYVMVQVLDSITYSGGWAFFLVAGVTIGFLNTFLLPLLKFISLPLVFVSAGLFLIVLNAVILWLTDELLEILDFTTIDFQINGALNFVLAALIFGLTNWFEHFLFKRLR